MYAGRNPGLAGKTTWKDNLSMKDHSPILKRNLTGCVAAVLLILFDQFTKMLAVAHLKDQPSNVLIDGVFELRYLENRGSAFGMMQNKLMILIPVTVVVTLFILYLFFKKLPATDVYKRQHIDYNQFIKSTAFIHINGFCVGSSISRRK